MKKTEKDFFWTFLSVFLPGLIIGAILFTATYGTKILDVTYDGWIDKVKDPDIHQHYLGWCHFRISPWSFPPGLMDSLSYPHKISILWTDSIPLFAMLFKCFRSLLPETFQYFGLYGLLSFCLTGGTAALLVHRLTRSRAAAFISVPFIAESFPMLQRMFYHTSLTAHYLIILPLLFWLYDGYKWPVWKKCLIWGSYFFLSVLLHPYLWAMGAVISVFSFLEEIIKTRDIRPAAVTGLVSAALTFSALFLAGAFYGNVGASYKPGGFECNLNAFFNPLDYSRFFGSLPLNNPNQYEGFAYLGLGGVLLLFSSAITALGISIMGAKNSRLRDNLRLILFIIMWLFFFFISVIPDISLNGSLLLRVKLPGVLETAAGIFRSGGRFIWPPLILLYSSGFCLLFRYAKTQRSRITVTAFALLFLCLQILDMSGTLSEKHTHFTKDVKGWHSDLESEALEPLLGDYKHIVLVTSDQILTERTAYFAMRNGLTLNRFYFARNIDEKTETTLRAYKDACIRGDIPEDVIFIFDEDSLREWKSCTGLHFYDLTGTIIGIAGELQLPEL